MTRLFYFICIFLLLEVLACEKKDEEITTDQFPEWLKAKITEITSQQNICSITDVTIIEYQGKKYYNVYCGLWSCVYCQFFDENGNHPTWNSSEWNDFSAKQKVIKTSPACSN